MTTDQIGGFGPSIPLDFNQPCTACLHFGELLDRGYSAWCLYPRDHHRRTGQALGCCKWEREPGSDDELLPDVQRRLAEGRPLY